MIKDKLDFLLMLSISKPTKQEIIEKAKVLKEQAQAHEKPTSMNQSFTEVENAVIERIMEIILQSGLSSQQAQTLLKKTITLLEWGEKAAPKMTH